MLSTYSDDEVVRPRQNRRVSESFDLPQSEPSLWDAFIHRMTSCCFSSAVKDVRPSGDWRSTSMDTQLDLLAELRRHNPEAVEAIDTIRANHGVVNESIEPKTVGVVNMLGEFGSDEALERVQTAAEQSVKLSTRILPPNSKLICMLDNLLGDQRGQSMHVLELALKPLLRCGGRSKFIGALKWIEATAGGSRQSKELLNELCARWLLLDLTETRNFGTRPKTQEEMYGDCGTFDSIQEEHASLKALSLQRVLTVRAFENALGDWMQMVSDAEALGSPAFLAVKRGSLAIAAGVIHQGDSAMFFVFDGGSALQSTLAADSDLQRTMTVTIKFERLPEAARKWIFRDPSIVALRTVESAVEYMTNLISLDPDTGNRRFSSVCYFILPRGRYDDYSAPIPATGGTGPTRIEAAAPDVDDITAAKSKARQVVKGLK